ncbi:hypothetical protein JMJ77_0002115, partial [Colletotrichum scovillei]
VVNSFFVFCIRIWPCIHTKILIGLGDKRFLSMRHKRSLNKISRKRQPNRSFQAHRRLVDDVKTTPL